MKYSGQKTSKPKVDFPAIDTRFIKIMFKRLQEKIETYFLRNTDYQSREGINMPSQTM